MTDSLSTGEIKKRSLTGARWLILTNAFGMPAAYLIAVLLGRTGPSALGAYALAQIFINVITAFTMLGGPPILRNYLPKIENPTLRGKFLFSYGVLLFILMTVVLVGFYSFPSFLGFLLQSKMESHHFGWFVLLTLVVVCSESLMGAAAGLMHIKLAAIARLMARIIILPIVVILYFVDRSFLLNHGIETIVGGLFAAYTIGALLCIFGMMRDPRIRLEKGWYFPKGFASFGLTSSAAMIFSFLYSNFDRMCVLNISDMEGLGMYQAVLSLVMLVDFVPTVMQTAIIPVFSSLQTKDRKDSLMKAYSFILRNIVILITLVSLVMIGFSRELLGLFSAQYVEYYPILAFFCLTSVVRSPAMPSLAVLLSKEKNFFRLSQSGLQIGTQVLITLLFIKDYGVLAIVGAKVITGILASLSGTLYVIYGMGIAPALPRSFKAAFLTTLLAVVSRIWLVPEGFVYSIVLTVLSIVCFVYFSRLRYDECLRLYRVLVTRNMGAIVDVSKVEY